MTNYTKTKPESIQHLFDSIAHRYDTTNGLMSFQLHRYWNKQLIKEILANGVPKTVLDLCAGTGEIAFGIQERVKSPLDLTLLDFSKEMLECAKQKKISQKARFIQADAQNIPLADCLFDAATCAYGIRNIKEPSRCIQEAYRVLRPGGVFAILELTQPKSFLIRLGHKLYLKAALPLIGKWMTQNKQAYHYLCQSIPQFIPPENLAAMMQRCGFSQVKIKPLNFGIATIISGRK
jgi:demethylmenaquinone methyltransferase/2-methoxy-6-polyprenyl-1,4-benzoquinol methylase